MRVLWLQNRRRKPIAGDEQGGGGRQLKISGRRGGKKALTVEYRRGGKRAKNRLWSEEKEGELG